MNDASLSKDTNNNFVNQHLEIQLCRDICNSTKHFELNNASVEADFTIIREYNPFSKVWGQERNNKIILSDGHKFELKALAASSITLWENFISLHSLI